MKIPYSRAKLSVHIVVRLICLSLIIFFHSTTPSHSGENSSPATKLDTVVLQLKWFHQFNFAGFYAAAEKGFYKEAGLEVIIKEGQPGQDFIDEVTSGHAQYGLEMPELLIARNAGKPVVALAAIFQHSPQILLARADSGIVSPHNLSGKRVMWRFDSAAELRAMLLNEKISLEQIEFVELSWDINDLIDGKVDAVHAYVTDQPLALKKAGIESSILYPIKYGIDFYGDCLFTSEKEINDNPARVKAFLEASLRGWSYAMENPEEIMNIITDKYTSTSTREYMRNEFTHMEQLMVPDLVEVGHMNPGRWKHIGDTFVKLGMLDPGYSLEGFLYEHYTTPNYNRLKKIAEILLSVVAFVSIGVCALFVYNRKLNKEVRERTAHLSLEIAERKRVEKSLSESEEKYRTLFNTKSDAIFIFDPVTTNLLETNKTTEKLYGYSKKELTGMSCLQLSAEVEETISTIQTIAEKTSVNIRRRMHKKKDGTIFPVEVFSYRISLSGKTVMFAVIRDISERINLEEQLRHAHKMEAVGTLAGGIAHDFNNILSAVQGYSELALDNIPDGNPAQKDIGEVLKASSRAKDLVKQVLAYSRKQKLNRKPLKVSEVVEEAINFLRATIPSNIQIRSSTNTTNETILANATQMHQVVMNLGSNAAFAMEKHGGLLSFEIQSTTLEQDDIEANSNLSPGDYVLLTVSDTGEGMPADVIDKIFDPYFTTKKFGEGSGMGLAVVHGIVRAHGGDISVASVPSEGTTFTLAFPAIENQELIVEGVEKESAPGGSEKIMIVDDEKAIADLTQNRLEKIGYQVTSLTDSIEALNIFQADPYAYDLLITDMSMPTMTGEQLVQKVLSIRPDLPIIMCTGYSSVIDADKASQIGIRAFLFKPIDNTQLAVTIRQVLDDELS